MDICPINGNPCPDSKSFQILKYNGQEFAQKIICEKCAYMQYEKNSENLLMELISKIENIENKYRKDVRRCLECNSSFEDIVSKSRLGCHMCYESFRDKVLAILTKCQAGYKHLGKKPKLHNVDYLRPNVENDIVLLKQKMQEAIDEENYELAGDLKEKLEKLKNKKV